ncbi:MAG: hypothetical protein JST66_03245 [Bacteroidetes bacterium]|nr:hypothetical protein [Bacteroidota bacterium]
MRTAFLLALLGIALRLGFFYGGVRVEAFQFAPVHLFLLVLVTFLTGFFLLKADPSRGMADLIRNGMRDAALYALMIALFTWVFYTSVNVTEFPERNERLIQGFIQQGHPEAEARDKVNAMYTPGGYATLTFFGLFIAGVVNALFFAAVHHKVLRRFRR